MPDRRYSPDQSEPEPRLARRTKPYRGRGCAVPSAPRAAESAGPAAVPADKVWSVGQCPRCRESMTRTTAVPQPDRAGAPSAALCQICDEIRAQIVVFFADRGRATTHREAKWRPLVIA